jgi:hypothetical protein
MSLGPLLRPFGERAPTPTVFEQGDGALARDDFALRQATVSSALGSVFRGKFCDAILPNRKPTTFEKGAVIYEVGEKDRTFFFLLSEYVRSERLIRSRTHLRCS